MNEYDADEYTLDRNRGEHRQPPLKLMNLEQDPVEDILGRKPTEEEIKQTFKTVQRRLLQLEIAIRVQNAMLFIIICGVICAIIWFLSEVL